jgi:FecR protein
MTTYAKKLSAANKARKSSVALLVISMMIFALPLEVLAADPFAGNITSLESDTVFHHATITRAGTAAKVTAAPGDAAFQGDTVRTDAGVKVRMSLADGSHIYIGPQSAVEVKNCLVDQSWAKRNTTLKALQGTVRFVISKLCRNKVSGAESSWKDSMVAVETHIAIAGIRGTDFTMTVGQDNVEIAVFDGVVSLKNADASIPLEITLTANQVSRIQRGSSPSPPTVLTPEMKERLLHDTTPAKVLRSDGDNAGMGSKKDRKKGEMGLAADLAAGVPLKDIINDAVKDGMNIEAIVSESLAEGVDPALVVYTAITEGYAAQAVVKAALKEGAPLDAVISAAAGAGADKNSIYVGAAEAGAPPAAVANAISSSSSPGAPVFGYTAPVQAPPAVYTPPAPVAIGGGGGATPSTKPASPSKP